MKESRVATEQGKNISRLTRVTVVSPLQFPVRVKDTNIPLGILAFRSWNGSRTLKQI